MRRLFRRGGRQSEANFSADEPLTDDNAGMADEFEPFVPVRGTQDRYDYDAGGPDADMPDAEPVTTAYVESYPEPEPEPRRRLRVSVPRIAAPRVPGSGAIRWDMLMWAAILILAGVIGTLLVRGEVSHDVEAWWPVVVVAFAVAWMVVALLRRHVASFLGAAALAGVGLSLIMDAQDIARFEETLFGVALVTIGLGIVIRGFLLRQRAPY